MWTVKDDPGGILAAAVDEFSDCLHECLSEICTLVASLQAENACAHVPIDERGRAKRLVMDLTQRPARPVVVEDRVIRRNWVGLLLQMTKPYTEPLAVLLAADTTGAISERLESSLKRIDAADLRLGRRIDALQRRNRQQSGQPGVPTREDKDRAELERLGVRL